MFYSVNLKEKFPFFISFEKRKLNKHIEQRVFIYIKQDFRILFYQKIFFS